MKKIILAVCSILLVFIGLVQFGEMGILSQRPSIKNELAANWPVKDFSPTFPQGGHSNSGVYHGGCPAGLHGGYVGSGDYYCHG